MSDLRVEEGNVPVMMKMYQRSLVDPERFVTLMDCAGPLGGGQGLIVSGDAGMLSRKVCKAGGGWLAVTPPGPGVDSKRELLGALLHELEGDELPAEDASFNIVVVIDFLENQEDEEHWVREFHRVLKPGGRLLIAAPAFKAWSVARSLRKALGFGEATRRPHGYRTQELYNLLKNGFDILEVRTHSRMFRESADAVQRRLAGSFAGVGIASVDAEVRAAALRRAGSVVSFLYPFALIVSFFDSLLFFTGGHRLVSAARSRPWKERREVKIRDGRSIAEATIHTRIGTAAEF